MSHGRDPEAVHNFDAETNPSSNVTEEPVETSVQASQTAFPDEPFACPACGQMLAASCRVCVACKQPIDPEQIVPAKPRLTPPPELDAATVPRLFKPVSFPWPIFFAVLAAAFAVAMVVQAVWGVKNGTLVMGGASILSSVWVSIDAHARRVPKPFRWGFGTIVLWCVFFPWYLARRRTPQAPCPFVEAEGRPISSYWLLMIVAFVLQYLLAGFLSRLMPQ
jgi:hypothetical protein